LNQAFCFLHPIDNSNPEITFTKGKLVIWLNYDGADRNYWVQEEKTPLSFVSFHKNIPQLKLLSTTNEELPYPT